MTYHTTPSSLWIARHYKKRTLNTNNTPIKELIIIPKHSFLGFVKKVNQSSLSIMTITLCCIHDL